jgi:hypothetical protein
VCFVCDFNYFPVSHFFIRNHLSCISFSLQCCVSLQSNNVCFTSSSPKHNGHLPLSMFHLTTFICHIPANNHATPLLSFLEQRSVYNFLPRKNSILCTVLMRFFLEILLMYFISPYHYISLSLTLTFLSNCTVVVFSTYDSYGNK